MTDKIKLIAHRGFCEKAPENSRLSFTSAGEEGYWAIETDVRISLDGVMVCCHDKDIESMYNGSGEISELTYRQLLEYKINTGNGVDEHTDDELRIPLFSEYLRTCAKYGALPFIEVKTANVADVIGEGRKYFADRDIIISSAEFAHLQQARAVSDEVFIHHIFSGEQYISQLADMGNSGMAFNYKYSQLLEPESRAEVKRLIDAAHSQNVKVCLRAGDNIDAVRIMTELGVDYIPTNKMTPRSLSAGL